MENYDDMKREIGQRAGEVTHLRWENIKDGAVVIRTTKGKGQRIAVWPDEVAELLEVQESGWVFPSPAGSRKRPAT